MKYDGPLIITFIAPPGAGKGTQAKFLQQTCNIVHLSTGDMLRDRAKTDDALGNKIKTILAAGTYADDTLMIEMIEDRTSQDDCKNGYILDGFPRSVPQAIALDEFLAEKGHVLGAVIELEVDEEKLIERITGRYNCVSCKTTFHDTLRKPKVDNVCDACQATEFERRADDTPENFAKRLKNYHAMTTPLLEYYRQQGRLLQVNGDDAAEKVSKRVLALLV